MESNSKAFQKLTYPEHLDRPKLAKVIKMAEDGDVVIKVAGGPKLGVVNVFCSYFHLSVSQVLRDAFSNVKAANSAEPAKSHKHVKFDERSKSPESISESITSTASIGMPFVDLTAQPTDPVLFHLQLLHNKHGNLPHRPTSQEELVAIIDMAVKLTNIPQTLNWLKNFTYSDGTSYLVEGQTMIIALEMAMGAFPSATAKDFAIPSADFIKRSTRLSLRFFKQTYFGSSFFNEVVHAGLHHEHEAILNVLIFRVEDYILNMTKTETIYPDSRKSCSRCSSLNILTAKACMRCSHKIFQPHFCSPQSRGGVFIEALFHVGLFPVSERGYDVSPTMLVKKAEGLKKYHHECAAPNGPCYLRRTLDGLQKELQGLMDSLPGLCIECARQGKDCRLSKLSPDCHGDIPHALNEHMQSVDARIYFNRRAVTGLDEDEACGAGGGATGINTSHEYYRNQEAGRGDGIGEAERIPRELRPSEIERRNQDLRNAGKWEEYLKQFEGERVVVMGEVAIDEEDEWMEKRPIE